MSFCLLDKVAMLYIRLISVRIERALLPDHPTTHHIYTSYMKWRDESYHNSLYSFLFNNLFGCWSAKITSQFPYYYIGYSHYRIESPPQQYINNSGSWTEQWHHLWKFKFEFLRISTIKSLLIWSLNLYNCHTKMEEVTTCLISKSMLE